MDNRAYWIWAQQAFGEGSSMPWRVFKGFSGGLEEFFREGPRLWNTLGSVTEQAAAALYGFSLEEAEARLEYAGKVGWNVYTPECEKYPEALRNIFDPPAVLYCKGTLPDVDEIPTVAIVGARRALPESRRAAKAFGYQLAVGGAAVVSGGAVGVDAEALLGAVSGNGAAVSVLPVDLGSPYVSSNAPLRRMIPEHGGALVTEYFSQRNPSRGAFQARNRLVTGLSCGVLLVQAALKSGTAMYGRLAAEQGRDVFVALPPAGLEGAPEFSGSQSLLEDGAKGVSSGEEILSEYSGRFGGPPPAENEMFQRLFEDITLETEPVSVEAEPVFADSGEPPRGLSPQAERVWAALGKTPLSIGQLEEKTGVGAGALLGILTELELEGLAVSAPGKRYRRG